MTDCLGSTGVAGRRFKDHGVFAHQSAGEQFARDAEHAAIWKDHPQHSARSGQEALRYFSHYISCSVLARGLLLYFYPSMCAQCLFSAISYHQSVFVMMQRWMSLLSSSSSSSSSSPSFSSSPSIFTFNLFINTDLLANMNRIPIEYYCKRRS